tara:strand:+ start:2317 stop:2802 length:486 start_codon:yes stop_codon:yes gene_type:complete
LGHVDTNLLNYLSALPETGHVSEALPDRFLIMRDKGRRGIANEESLLDMCSRNNITPVYLEKYSWEEQSLLFKQAKLIISPHGAGLSNIVFCQNEECKVIEVFSRNYGTPAFNILALNLGLSYYSFLEDGQDGIGCFKSNARHKFDDIYFPINKIAGIVEE